MDIDPFSHVPLKEHVEAILKERNERIEERFRALDEAVKVKAHNTVNAIAIVTALLSLAIAVGAYFHH